MRLSAPYASRVSRLRRHATGPYMVRLRHRLATSQRPVADLPTALRYARLALRRPHVRSATITSR